MLQTLLVTESKNNSYFCSKKIEGIKLSDN